MTRYFNYADLTWPEVAALPRNTPLIIPLGERYPLEKLSESLGNPSSVGLLPPIPYGWEGSGLRLDDQLLEQFLSNLLASLRDDGFSQVYTLTPPGIAQDLGVLRIALSPNKINLPDLPAKTFIIPPDSARNKVVIIPIGHTEQHGLHLPMATDTFIIEAIAQGVTNAAPERAVTLPVMPYGVSTHRPSFAGTLNTGGRAFEDLWVNLVDTLADRGFDRFYLISGHGGNCSFLVNVTKYAGERHRRIFCTTAWLYLSGPQGIAAIEKHRQSAIGGMGHAGELETSLILHLRPDLVHMERVVDETDFISTSSYYMDWVEGGALVANPPWDDDTKTGAYGAGSLATAENGDIWLKAAIAEKVNHVDEIHEQQERREARRKTGFGLWADRI